MFHLSTPVDFSRLPALACRRHTFPTNLCKLGYLNNNIVLLMFQINVSDVFLSLLSKILFNKIFNKIFNKKSCLININETSCLSKSTFLASIN